MEHLKDRTDLEMADIEALARRHSEARAYMGKTVKAAEEARRKAVRPHVAALHDAGRRVAETEADLIDAIALNKGLFKKPKTRKFHDLKVGLRKMKGEITFRDAARVVALIRRHFKTRFDDLVKVTETPRKDALSALTGAELKRLGVAVTNDTDAPVVTMPKSDLRQHVEALMVDFQPAKGKGK